MDESVKSGDKLEVSVSFGRFEKDALAWEKWSSFSPNKYLDEIGSLSTPGSVAQKKAYFEAHYKKIAAAKKIEESEHEKHMNLVHSTTDESCSENSSGIDASLGLSNDGKSTEENADTASSIVLTNLINDDVANEDNARSDQGVELDSCTNDLMESAVSEEKLEEESIDDIKCDVVESKLDVKEESVLIGAEVVREDSVSAVEKAPEMKNGVVHSCVLEKEMPKLKNATQKVIPMKKNRDLSAPPKKSITSPVVKSSHYTPTPRHSKPTPNTTPTTASQSSKKKSNQSPLPNRKIATLTSLHMSLNLGSAKSSAPVVPVPITRKSLIMEQMGDKDIVRRAFKSFQNYTNSNANGNVLSPHERSSTVKQVQTTAFKSKVSTSPAPRKGNEGPRNYVQKVATQRSQSATRTKPFPSSLNGRPDRSSAPKNTVSVSPPIALKSDERAEKRREFLKKLEAKSIVREAENAQRGAKSKMKCNTSKRSRVEGRTVTRSERSRRWCPRRVVEEEVPLILPHIHHQFMPPIQQYRLPTPDLSGASGSSSQRMYGSSYQEFSIPSSYDEESEEDANDGSPDYDDLIPSYKSHVAHSIWNGEDRGVLKIHHRFMTVRTWNVVREDAATLIESSGLGGLPGLMYDSLDAPLICAFIERWYPETNTFHMPFGEMTITLHDTQFILGIPVMGEPVCPSCDGNPALTLTTLANALGIPNQAELKAATSLVAGSVKQTAMRMLAMSEGIQPSKFARIYLWWVLTNTLFVDKSKTHGHASFIELLRRPDQAQQYAWGAGALANLYRELGAASRSGGRQVAGCMTLLQAWIYAYFPRLRPQARQSWTPGQPFASLWIPISGRHGAAEQALMEYRRQLDNLTAESIEWLPFGAQPGSMIPISCFRGIIHCRSINEPYMPDRVARQFGYIQTIPRNPVRPSSCMRPANPRGYVVKHDPAHWVFTDGYGLYHHTFDTFEVAEVASACSQTYMEWYLQRTHPKVRRVDDEDDAEDAPEVDDHGLLQHIAGLVAPYHRNVYGGSSDERDHILLEIADLTERLMPKMNISSPN